ncbi:MAG TPA: hypothetical protein VI997_00735, partial [Candidatus Thermoplasmatota archaeon]|nr:hypothetical protein [Candidatus Thermoplasmatota archaeon]
MRIGLVAPTSEAEAALVADRLRARGAEPFLLDLSTFPSSSRVSIHVAQSVRILHEGRDIADASAWFVRRFASTAPLMRTPPTVPEGPALHGRLLEWAVAEDEKSVFVGSLLALLAERAPLVNPPHAFEGHFRKHHAAFLLRKAGLRVPEFVTGNDPVALREFLARHGRAVHKPTSGGRHVKEVTRERLDARAEALAT